MYVNVTCNIDSYYDILQHLQHICLFTSASDKISGHTSHLILKISKYFTIGNMQTKYILCVWSTRLLCCGLIDRGNPPLVVCCHHLTKLC